MKLQKYIIILTSFLIVSCRMGTGFWEASLHKVNNSQAITFSLKPNGNLSRTVILNNISFEKSTGSYRLPEEVGGISESQVSFSDTTVLPGRVTLIIKNHTFDILQRALIIDGKEFPWNSSEFITIEDSESIAPANTAQGRHN
jgi:hypothetical protein